MLAKTLELLSDRIIAFNRGDQFDEVTWFRHLNKIYKYMNILEMNKHLEPKFTLSYGKVISYHNKLNVDDKESTSTHTSNSFIQETKREINTIFMKNNYGKTGKRGNSKENKKTNRSKSKKSKSPRYGKGHKSGKTIPNQVTEQPIDRENVEKVVSTARNENSNNLIVDNGNQPEEVEIHEESKIEVIETNEKNNIKVTTETNEITQNILAENMPVSQDPSLGDNNTPEKTQNIGNNTTVRSSGRKVKVTPKLRNKSNKRQGRGMIHHHKNSSATHNRRQHSHEQDEIETEQLDQMDHNLNSTEIVPPISDPNAEVFSSPAQNILAKSRRIKKKKRRVINSQYQGGRTYNQAGMWSAFPGRKMYYKKGVHSRGHSVNSGRSSRSKKKYRHSSRSSRSSRSSTNSKIHGRTNIRKMKKRYIRNVLPRVNGQADRKLIVKKFTNPR